MALQIVTPPTVEPITLAEAKAHLRVDHTDDDTLISLLIKSARSHLDGKNGYLGRALIQQTWDFIIDFFPENEIRIPLPPLISVTSVIYLDAGGVEQTVPVFDYTVDNVSEPGWVVPSTNGWPTPFEGINAVRIRFVAGYTPIADSPVDLASNVPFAIKAAMLLLIGSLYANRENVVAGTVANELPWGVKQLLQPYRIEFGIA
jgi:uncharacterized phiE125 gp8 family phage protein